MIIMKALGIPNEKLTPCSNDLHVEMWTRETTRAVSSYIRRSNGEIWVRCERCGLEVTPGVELDDSPDSTDSEESVDHPPHYNKHPSGVECIDVVEHFSFNLGNAIKYIWRADHKENTEEDLEKAIWYLKRELERRDDTRSVSE